MTWNRRERWIHYCTVEILLLLDELEYDEPCLVDHATLTPVVAEIGLYKIDFLIVQWRYGPMCLKINVPTHLTYQ